MLKDKKIGLLVSGGIAAYKTTEIVRSLVKAGGKVRVAMTTNAQEIIPALTLQVLSRQKVLVDTFDEWDPEHVQHIEFADWCDLMIIAPATANIIGKIANGIADDIVSSIYLAATCPKLIVPAMNEHMLMSPSVQRNLSLLVQDGCYVMEPDYGFLAEGYEGKGRLPQIPVIVEEIELTLTRRCLPQTLAGKKVLVTAGGTIERIDPVRYISNDSSGKMGLALAKAAHKLGAEVHLITTKDLGYIHPEIRICIVQSANEMHEAIIKDFKDSHYLVMAAAVSDFAPLHPSNEKIKKKADEDRLVIELKKNPDILASMAQERDHQILVGFAAETQNVKEYAQAKIEKKGIDWIIANDVSKSDIAFNSDYNEVLVIHKDGREFPLEKMDKNTLAEKIWNILCQDID